jgi:hypothetical protein
MDTGRRTCGSTGVLTGTACRWMRPLSHSAGRSAAPRIAALLRRQRALVADGAQGRGLHCRQRPGHPAGPLGRRRRLFSHFTLAAEISALLIAADLAQSMGQSQPAEFLRQMADTWNDNIERWTYAVNSDLARQVGVEGYYVRIAPPDGDGAASPLQGFVPIKNRARALRCAGGGDRQPGCARSGALRPARAMTIREC